MPAMEHIHTPNPFTAPRAEIAPVIHDAGPKRPLAATVVGGIAVFIGGTNLLFLPLVFINRSDQMRIFAEMGYQPAVVHALQVVFPLLFLGLLVVGRGLLKLRAWAPRAFRWYAAASVVVLMLRGGYVGFNLAAGVRPADPILYQTMQLQLVGDALLIAYAVLGSWFLLRPATQAAYAAAGQRAASSAATR